jgi:hypothetical protein
MKNRTSTRNTSLRCLGLAVLAVCMFLVVQGAVTQDRGFGLGVIIGEPTGLSAKYWVSRVNAIDFGLGWSVGGNWVGRSRSHDDRGRRVHYHMDYLWHSFNAIHSSQRFPLYYGIGGRLNAGAGYDESLAIRGVIGIAWLPLNTPADFFIEIVPSFELLPASAFGLDAGIGARYYF